jgi:hypothetical protein
MGSLRSVIPASLTENGHSVMQSKGVAQQATEA